MSTPVSHIDWILVPDFDSQSQLPHCSMTGFPKRKGEPGVWRGALIEFEGFFTISQMSAEQLAKAMGWVSPDQVDELVASQVEDKSRIEELEAQLEAARNLLSAYEAAESAGV